ncbi:MAG: glycosyltransferase [Sphingomicrobium sp.]
MTFAYSAQSSNVALGARRIAAAGGILMTMPSLSQRGGERVGILLANGFAGAGIPVRIALVRDAGEAEEKLTSMLHPYVSISSAGPPLARLGRKYLQRVRAVPFIRRQIESFGPAVVLGTVNSVGLVTALSRDQTNAGPSFALKLTNRLAPPEFGTIRRLQRHKSFDFIFSRFDLVLTLSEAERRGVLELYPGREYLFRNIPNPYVTNDMLSGPAPERSGPRRILAAGRMVRQKRLDILLRAFSLSENKSSRLVILGDGPFRSELRRLADSLGIADRVEMPGFAEDLIPWLRKSDLFVLSSDYEGLPAVVLEALACAVPVVTTDSFPSAHELVGGLESCAITPTGNAERLAEAIDHTAHATADPNELRRLASGYLVDDSVSAHIIEIARLVENPPGQRDRIQ